MDSSARRMAKGIREVKKVEAQDRTKTKHRNHGEAQTSRRVESNCRIFTTEDAEYTEIRKSKRR
jgi:hypothetical protein